MQLINRENPRKGFTFLLSFYQATENLSDEVRLECLDTVIRYGLYNEEKSDNDIAKIILAMAKPNIDAASARYDAAVANGKKGGAPKGNKNARKKKRPENNQNLTSDTTRKQPENNLDTDTDTEAESESNIDKDSDYDSTTEQADAVSVDRQTASAAAEAEPSAGDLFSVEQLSEIVQRNKVNLSQEGICTFYDEMTESGWILYENPIEKKGIVKAIRGYAKYHPEFKKEKKSADTFSDIMRKAKKEIPSELIKLYLRNSKNWLLLIPEYCDIELFTDMERQEYKRRFDFWKEKIDDSELSFELFKEGWGKYLKER